MLHACRRRGLRDVVRLDLEALPFRQCVFDAAWAHTSLIHIPKSRLTGALAVLGQKLRPGGVLFVALRAGKNDGYLGKSGVERWFAHFEKGEFERHIPPGFEILKSSKTAFKSAAFLNYHLRKKCDI
jgi:SAM-dependent methyltransferase